MFDAEPLQLRRSGMGLFLNHYLKRLYHLARVGEVRQPGSIPGSGQRYLASFRNRPRRGSARNSTGENTGESGLWLKFGASGRFW
jgi:hypothetical protein